MNPFDTPSDSAREHIIEHVLHCAHGGTPDSYYDLLMGFLERAQGMAGLIGSGANAGESSGLKLSDLAKTAFELSEKLDLAICLLNSWYEDHMKVDRALKKESESFGKYGTVSPAPQAPE
jgi:hypothetical protein